MLSKLQHTFFKTSAEPTGKIGSLRGLKVELQMLFQQVSDLGGEEGGSHNSHWEVVDKTLSRRAIMEPQPGVRCLKGYA